MNLIIGLGNPGKKYESTRHNIGFDVINELARRGDADRVQLKFDSELTECQINSQKVLLAKPLTYMNLSGKAIRQIVDFYKLNISDLLVICDDLNLDTGRLRLRGKGSSGGQKGLQNTIDQLGGRSDFARLRIGIGRPDGKLSVTDYVLKKFSQREQEDIQHAIQVAADAAEHWMQGDLVGTMNKFNSPTETKRTTKKSTDEESS
ncbi:Peptidyl-tRNA hydrolase [Polystyrenella longa]|uniref:Peptidyl-tRNA hydrolase n=1 Tax=Polystyrenella longa TaxID=2528007 RepID=A0A518CKK0_9PLAN|nr:aminoacyl-tRNA hydrolase [Polystyrenella longa]QDU79714.1 Peptidyl-tRNA hydrolase [Polystyrenella longa]